MALYRHIDELPSKARNRLQDTLVPSEEFVIAAHSEGLFSWAFPFFVVTTQRFIRFRELWLSDYFSDIAINRLSHVEYSSGMTRLGETLELEGMDVEESFTFSNGEGREIADALRAQLAKKETA